MGKPEWWGERGPRGPEECLLAARIQLEEGLGARAASNLESAGAASDEAMRATLAGISCLAREGDFQRALARLDALDANRAPELAGHRNYQAADERLPVRSRAASFASSVKSRAGVKDPGPGSRRPSARPDDEKAAALILNAGRGARAPTTDTEAERGARFILEAGGGDDSSDEDKAVDLILNSGREAAEGAA